MNKRNIQVKEVIIKNPETRQWELNLPSVMQNREVIQYLNTELLEVNKVIKEQEEKKQALIQLLDEKVKIQKRSEDQSLIEREKLQKSMYLQNVKDRNHNNTNSEVPNNIFDASQNPYNKVNQQAFTMNKNQSGNQNNFQSLSQVNVTQSKVQDSRIFGSISDKKDNTLDSQYKDMNFHTDLTNDQVINHEWDTQRLSNNYVNHSMYSGSQNNNNNNSNDNSEYLNNTQYDPKGYNSKSIENPEYKKMDFMQEEEVADDDKKKMVDELNEKKEKALQQYFEIPNMIMKNLRIVDELDDQKLSTTGNYFGLKVGKAHTKQTKQALKDINWFLTRNKLPPNYLTNYKKNIEGEIEIPEESLVTQFEYKH